MFGEHPLHLLAESLARATRRPEPPAQPSESVESFPIAVFDALEPEADRSRVVACRSAQSDSVAGNRLGRVMWNEEKLGRFGRMYRVRRWWLERMCVDQGCEWDRCNVPKGAAGPCLGSVGHWEARFGKGQKLVTKRVSDGCNEARRRSFLWADVHDDYK